MDFIKQLVCFCLILLMSSGHVRPQTTSEEGLLMTSDVTTPEVTTDLLATEDDSNDMVTRYRKFTMKNRSKLFKKWGKILDFSNRPKYRSRSTIHFCFVFIILCFDGSWQTTQYKTKTIISLTDLIIFKIMVK